MSSEDYGRISQVEGTIISKAVFGLAKILPVKLFLFFDF